MRLRARIKATSGKRIYAKENLAIVLGSTSNYFFATGTVVLNLLKFSPDLADDIIIYYDRIDERDGGGLILEITTRSEPELMAKL